MSTSVGAVVFAIFALFLLSLTAMCVYESLALWRGWTPITPFIRADIDHHRAIAMAVTIFVGVLIGHFWR